MKSNNRLTHPEKVLYPEKKITKRQLFDYYNTVQKWILPHIIHRPLTLVRCPEGYHQECFFQKHLTYVSPNLKSIPIKEKNKKENYIYIDSSEGLLDLIQLNVLEIHTWGSHINKIEYPDRIVFDLDPAPLVKWKKVVEAAFDIKNQLQQFKLKSFVKSTGGKGLHIVIPIYPEYSWEDVKIFTHTVVDYLVSKYPEKYVGTVSKSKRVGKIFIDYLRNQRGATSIAPYSTRARMYAPVSAPLHWDELTSRIKDTLFTVETMLDRIQILKQDPWKDFFKVKQSLRLDKL